MRVGKTRDYSIHNLINFRITNRTNRIRQFYDGTKIQFCNFISGNYKPYDFNVEIGAFSPQTNACVITDDKYYIADDYIYFRDKRKLSKYEVEITNIDESPDIKIRTNFIGNIMMPLNVVEFFIQFSLLKKGLSVIHSSGVDINSKCVMFPARSGGGKTTVALSLLERGFSYLGDNYIILDRGIARNYISPLNVFTYNRLPVVEKNLTTNQRFSMFLKRLLYTATKGHFKIFEKINPIDLFNDKIEHQFDIGLICFLDVDNTSGRCGLSVQKVSRKQLIKKLKYNMELDLLPFSKHVYSYGYMFPNSRFANFWKLYEQNLEQNIPSDITALTVSAPQRWTNAQIDEIVNLAGCTLHL